MKSSYGDLGVRDLNRIKTMEYLAKNHCASRAELSKQLNLSMPTVFQIVNELMEQGLIYEAGEYDSTGGRRAKMLTVCPDSFCTAGVVISKNHVRMVLLDFSSEIIDNEEVEIVFEDREVYYRRFGELLRSFLNRERRRKTGRLLCVGVVLPGTLDPERKTVSNCASLGVPEIDLRKIEQAGGVSMRFVSTKHAVIAEMKNKKENMIYLSLNERISGSAYLNGKVYIGNQNRSMRFGHLTLVPEGRSCYCGKRGCFEAYCSATALEAAYGKGLEAFLADLEAGDNVAEQTWDEYLKYLSVMVVNMRMIFDCQIILGGKIGGCIAKYPERLEKEILKHCVFEKEASFVVPSRYRKELYATGAARLILENCILEGRFFKAKEESVS